LPAIILSLFLSLFFSDQPLTVQICSSLALNQIHGLSDHLQSIYLYCCKPPTHPTTSLHLLDYSTLYGLHAATSCLYPIAIALFAIDFVEKYPRGWAIYNQPIPRKWPIVRYGCLLLQERSSKRKSKSRVAPVSSGSFVETPP
jgi:hypothetical protein